MVTVFEAIGCMQLANRFEEAQQPPVACDSYLPNERHSFLCPETFTSNLVFLGSEA